jgi:hypothetical protein
MQRVCRAESTQGKNEGLPTLLPLLPKPRLTLWKWGTRASLFNLF